MPVETEKGRQAEYSTDAVGQQVVGVIRAAAGNAAALEQLYRVAQGSSEHCHENTLSERGTLVDTHPQEGKAAEDGEMDPFIGQGNVYIRDLIARDEASDEDQQRPQDSDPGGPFLI